MVVPTQPRGTVAFLFTDIASSTRLWQQEPSAMQAASARHDTILRQAITTHGGVVYKVIGDAVQAAFATAPHAVTAAAVAQRALTAETWANHGLSEPLRVRMALHVGAVDPDADGDYRSPVLNRLGRLLGAGHGSQVLLSEAVQSLSRDRLPVGCGTLALGQHRFKDLLQAEPVYQLTGPGLPTTFPPLASLERRLHNLPVQPTPLIGREREVALVVDLIQRGTGRLVTLTGPGGTGKTRLSLQVAAELSETLADGVWFVPLATAHEPALVPAAIAAALGVQERGAWTHRELIREQVQDKQLLLVLDNFEQVTAAAVIVGELLAEHPGLRVLATSRIPLRLRAEQEYAVPPLGLPRRKPPPTLAELSQYAAVQLFIARAVAVRPTFAVTNESAPAIAEICHQLDGLPLAIELAAARVKLLPPVALLTRLEKRLPLLAGGARDLPARQQTLRATIAWSYDLLTAEEQAVFRRLAVFAGGCSLVAAETVIDPERADDVFAGLARLVDHSLLSATAEADTPRVQMLETIREFATEQLVASGEDSELRRRHATWCVALAETAWPELLGPQQATWLRQLDQEHDNMLAALAWALDHAPPLGQRLTVALLYFWTLRGHMTGGRQWLDRYLALPATAFLRARLLEGAGALAAYRDDLDAAITFADAAITLYRKIDDKISLSMALTDQAIRLFLKGDIARALASSKEAEAICRLLHDQSALAGVLTNLGEFARSRGEMTEAIRLNQEAVTLAAAVGQLNTERTILTNLGHIERQINNPSQSLGYYRRALTLAQQAGVELLADDLLEGLGGLAVVLQRPAAAARLLGMAADLRVVSGMMIAPYDRAQRAAELSAVQGALPADVFQREWSFGQALSPAEAVVEAMRLADELSGTFDP